MLVDGLAVSDLQEVVIRDRQMLGTDGMFCNYRYLRSKTGKLKSLQI